VRRDDISVATYTELLLMGPRGRPWIRKAVPSSYWFERTEKNQHKVRLVIARIHKQPLKGQTQSEIMLNYFHSKIFIIANKRNISCVVTFFTESPTVPQTSGTPNYYD